MCELCGRSVFTLKRGRFCTRCVKGLPREPSISELCKRDNWICHLCGNKVPVQSPPYTGLAAPTKDHVIPRSHPNFVPNDPDNVRLAHAKCNFSRNNKPLDEWFDYIATKRLNKGWIFDNI